jgi:glutamate-5-semialdehyde dehydrogenase
MNIALKAPIADPTREDVAGTMHTIGANARAVARTLALLSPDQKTSALAAMARAIRAATPAIL